GQAAVAEPQPRSVVLRLQLDFDEGRPGSKSSKIGPQRAPSPREGYAAKRHDLGIFSARDIAWAYFDLENSTGLRIELLKRTEPVRHQLRIDEEFTNRFWRRSDKDVTLNHSLFAAHRRGAFRVEASAARLSCTRCSSQNRPSSARSRAIAARSVR